MPFCFPSKCILVKEWLDVCNNQLGPDRSQVFQDCIFPEGNAHFHTFLLSIPHGFCVGCIRDARPVQVHWRGRTGLWLSSDHGRARQMDPGELPSPVISPSPHRCCFFVFGSVQMMLFDVCSSPFWGHLSLWSCVFVVFAQRLSRVQIPCWLGSICACISVGISTLIWARFLHDRTFLKWQKEEYWLSLLREFRV